MSDLRLAIVSTHPIQYYAPVFRALAALQGISARVFYTWSQVADGTIYDTGFRTTLKWDVPLLDGYSYEFVANVASRPGSDHFFGIRNPRLTKIVEHWQPSAVLVYGWHCWSHLQVLRHFKGKVPVLFRGDATLLDAQPRLRRALRRAVLRWIYRHVDLAIAAGQSNRDYFSWCGLPDANIALAPHSIDVQRFWDADGAHERKALAWRRELGIADDTPVVVYAGKLIPKKDPGLLLEAFCRLETPAHLVFYGNGELETQLQARARKQERVHFRPFQNQLAMPVVYRVGDLFVLPSRGPQETWGLALNEALASGRPVIAGSKVGAARDLVDPGRNGWIFESGDCEALVGALRSALAQGREGLSQLGAVGQRMSDAWSAQHSAEMMATAIRRRVCERAS